MYERISDDRDDQRHGVTNQDEDLRDLVAWKGGTVGRVYVDNDVSASKRRPRPGFDAMLRDAADGVITGIAGVDVDRLIRLPRELEVLVDMYDLHGVELATVRGDIDLGTPQGRLMARQLGAYAAYEVEHKAERQRRRNLQKAQAGEYHGGRRPFGFHPDGLTVREDEAVIVKQLAERLLAGESVNSLTRWLIIEQVPTVSGGTWTTQAVKRILRGPRVAGLRSYQGAVLGPAKWPALLDVTTWERVSALLGDPARQKTTRNTRIRVYVLGGGLVECGLCRSHLVGRPSQSGKRGYVCPSKPPWNGCGRIRIAADPFEDWLAARVIARLSKPGAVAKVAARLARRGDDPQAIAVALVADEAQLRQLGEDYANRRVPREAFLTAAAVLQERIDGHRRHLADGVPALDVAALDPASYVEWWGAAPIEQRRAFIATMVDRVVVRPATRPGLSGMDEQRVTVHWHDDARE